MILIKENLIPKGKNSAPANKQKENASLKGTKSTLVKKQTENDNQERINPAPAKKEKELKYCDFCNKEYKNYFSLSNHYKNVHKGKINQCKNDPRTYLNRLETMEKEGHERKMEYQEIVKWKKAKEGLTDDRDIDRRKGRIIRVCGLNKTHFHQPQNDYPKKNLKERVEDDMTTTVRKSLPAGFYFKILKTNPNLKMGNQINVDIEFCESTNVILIFHYLEIFFKKMNSKYSVSTLKSAGTEIRTAILNAIGKKICGDEKKWNVYLDSKFKIRINILKNHKDQDGENEVEFSHKFQHAIAKYGHLMEPNDFEDTASVYKKFGLKNEALDQFLVSFPPQKKTIKKGKNVNQK